MWKRKRFVGFALLLILVSSAFVGLFANAGDIHADKVGMMSHGGEVARGLNVDGSRGGYSIVVTLDGTEYSENSTVQVLKGIPLTFNTSASIIPSGGFRKINYTWGDGTYTLLEEAAGQYIFNATHTYAYNGTYTMTISSWGDVGGWYNATFYVFAWDTVITIPLNLTGNSLYNASDVAAATRIHAMESHINGVYVHAQNGSNLTEWTTEELVLYKWGMLNNMNSSVDALFKEAHIYAMYSPEVYTFAWSPYAYSGILINSTINKTTVVTDTLVCNTSDLQGTWEYSLSLSDDLKGMELKSVLDYGHYGQVTRLLMDMWGATHDLKNCTWGDGKLTDAEADSLLSLISQDMLENVTGSDITFFAPTKSFFQVNGLYYSYINNSLQGIELAGTGAYNSTDDLNLSFKGDYSLNGEINLTDDIFVIVGAVGQDRARWNVTEVLNVPDNFVILSVTPVTVTRGTDDWVQTIDYDNNSVYLDPDEDDEGWISVTIKKVETSATGAVSTTGEEVASGTFDLLSWLRSNWLLVTLLGLAVVGAYLFVGGKSRGRKRRR